MSGFIKNRNLGVRIVTSIAILIVLISAALTAFGFFSFSRSHEQQVTGAMKKNGISAGKLVDMEISTYIKQVEVISRRPEIKTMDFDVQKPVLVEEAKRIGFERFQVDWPDGSVISTTGHHANAADRPFFKQAMSGISNISDVLFARIDLKMTIVVSAPIYDDNNKIVGVLSGVTSSKQLNDIVEHVDLDYEGYCFVINKAGEKMAGIDYTGVETLDNDLKKENTAGITGLVEVEKQMINGGTGIETFKQDKKNYYLSWSPINNGDWILGIVQNKDEADVVLHTMLVRMILIAALFCVIGILCGIFVSRALTPLKVLRDNIQEISSGKGDLTKRIDVKSNNEIGEVVDGFNVFSNKLQEIVFEIKDSKADLLLYGERLGKMVQENATFITEMVSNMQSVGGELEKQHGKVGSAVGAVDAISNAVQQLHSLLQTQEQGVSTASSAVTQMIGNIDSVSHSIEKMAEEFNVLQSDVGNGIDKEREVNNQIQNIEEQSKMLNEANAVISSIAEQTNLLAMNAAIEAAHAGESGKGFAVVADEIRKLSENSSSQSKSIGNQLSAILSSISNVVQASDVSDKVFTNVSKKINDTGDLVRQIKLAMDEQSEGSKQIGEALSEMNDATGQVRGASDDVDRARHGIIDDVESLKVSSETVRASLENMENSVKRIEKDDDSLMNIATEISGAIYRINTQIDQFKV